MKRYEVHLRRKRFYYWAAYGWIYLCNSICLVVSRGRFRFEEEYSLLLNVFSFVTVLFAFLFPLFVLRFRPEKKITFFPVSNMKSESPEMKRVIDHVLKDLEIDPDSIQILCLRSRTLATALPWYKLIKLGQEFFEENTVVQRYVFMHEYAHIQQEDRVHQLSIFMIPSFLLIIMNISTGVVLALSLCCGLVGYLLYCAYSVQREYAADTFAVEFLARKGLLKKLEIAFLKVDAVTFIALLLWTLLCLFAAIGFSYLLFVMELVFCAPLLIFAILNIAKMSHPFYPRRNASIRDAIQVGLENKS